MNIIVKISTDNNEAFDTVMKEIDETTRILRTLADKIQTGIVDLEPGTIRKLLDVNGNPVGTYEVKS